MEAESLPLPLSPAVAMDPVAQPACWMTALLKEPSPPTPEAKVLSRVVGSCTSSKGISIAVVDANALIHGDKLAGCADKFVSVPEVLEEVRDPVSRQRLSFLPFLVETVEPSPEFIKKVVKFARETGDLQTLSDVDLKIIALAYMLEAQVHGTAHLRDRPPPLHVLNVKNLPEAEMPGWGSNVPNLAEWEALEQAPEGGADHNSRILAVKDLNNLVESDSRCGSMIDEQDDGHPSFSIPKKYFAPKKEIVLEGKKMVAFGIDSSQGEDTESTDDWRPAVSRSTHRRYLRRKARRELSEASEDIGSSASNAGNDDAITELNNVPSEGVVECHEFDENQNFHQDFETEVSANEALIEGKGKDVAMGFDFSQPSQEDIELDRLRTHIGLDHSTLGEDMLGKSHDSFEGDKIDELSKDLDNMELKCQADGSVGADYVDDESSEQSWMLKSLSESSVACATSDYAMQNVLLQIGLRLLAPGGMQIRQLHR